MCVKQKNKKFRIEKETKTLLLIFNLNQTRLNKIRNIFLFCPHARTHIPLLIHKIVSFGHLDGKDERKKKNVYFYIYIFTIRSKTKAPIVIISLI